MLTQTHRSESAEELVAGLVFVLQERRRLDGAVLPLATLMEEIRTWVTSARTESWLPKGKNLTSLRQEVTATGRSVGPNLRKHLGAGLTTYLRAAQETLNRSDRPPAQTAHLLEVGQSLQDHLATPVALFATWADLTRCVADLAFFDAIATTEQLEAQVGLAHRDGNGVLDEILRILRRNPRSVEWARQRLRDDPSKPRSEVHPKDTSDVAPDELLALAERSLVQTEPEAHVVAWALYDRAASESGITEVGPITVYLAEWLIGRVFNTDDPDPILKEVRAVWHAEHDNESGYDFREHVLVRVDLGTRTPDGALEEAIDHAETMMDALLSLGAGSRWGKARWWALLVDGEEMESQSGGGSRRPDFSDSLGMEDAARTLAREAGRLGRAFSKSVPWHLREALRACAEASHATSRAVSLYSEWRNDDRTVLLLLDAALEHIAALGNTRSERLVERIGELWPESVRTGLTLWAIDSCIGNADSLFQATPEARELKREIVRKRDGLQHTSLIVAYRALNRLLGLCSSPLQARVVRRTIGQLGDAVLYREETERLAEEARLIFARQRRVRNGLTHGNPVTRPVLSSVLPFSNFRTVVAIRSALDSISKEVTLESHLEALRAKREGDLDHIRRGESLVDAWEAQGF